MPALEQLPVTEGRPVAPRGAKPSPERRREHRLPAHTQAREEGRETEGAIRTAGGEAAFVRLDVTNESDWRRAVGAAISRFGQLNILVNNAGVSGGGRVEDVSLEEWNRVMDVNSTGVFLGTKAAIPAMRQEGGGSIINLSSQLGLVGADNSGPQYQAFKG